MISRPIKTAKGSGGAWSDIDLTCHDEGDAFHLIAWGKFLDVTVKLGRQEAEALRDALNVMFIMTDADDTVTDVPDVPVQRMVSRVTKDMPTPDDLDSRMDHIYQEFKSRGLTDDQALRNTRRGEVPFSLKSEDETENHFMRRLGGGEKNPDWTPETGE